MSSDVQNQNAPQPRNVDLFGFFARMAKFWIPAVLVGLVVAGLYGVKSFKNLTQTTYQANSTLVYTLPNTDNDAVARKQISVQILVLNTYVSLAKSPEIMEQAAKSSNGKYTADQLSTATNLEYLATSTMLTLTAVSPDSQTAATEMADLVADSLAKNIVRVSGYADMDYVPQIRVATKASPLGQASVSGTFSKIKSVGIVGGLFLVSALFTAGICVLVSSRRKASVDGKRSGKLEA